MLILSHDSAYDYYRYPSKKRFPVAQRRRRALLSELFRVDGGDITGYRISGTVSFMAPPYHTVCEPGKCRKNTKNYIFHQQRLASGDLLYLASDLYVTSPGLTFAQMSSKLDFIPLLIWGYELCGSAYTDFEGGRSERRRLTTASELQLAAERYGKPKAAKAAQFVIDGSDSLRETKLLILLTLPHRYGGYNLPRPQVNVDVRLGLNGQAVWGRETIAPDLLWPGVAVEYNGANHNKDVDAVRREALAAEGYKVLEVNDASINSRSAMDSLASEVAKHLGVRNRVQIADFPGRQAELRAALGLEEW